MVALDTCQASWITWTPHMYSRWHVPGTSLGILHKFSLLPQEMVSFYHTHCTDGKREGK